jgi:cytochrome c553
MLASSCFPRIEIGVLAKKKGSNQKDSGIRSPLDNAKIKKLNAWIASLTMSTLKKNTGHQLIMPQQSVIPTQLNENS